MKYVCAFGVLLTLVGLVLNFSALSNQSLFFFINQLLPVVSIWTVVTTLGDGAVAGCVFYLVFRKRTDLLVKGLVGAVAGLIASQGLKAVFTVARPEHTPELIGRFHLLTQSMSATNFSMPSGHTITAFLLGTLLLHYLKLNGMAKVALVTAMVLIAVSRVALGVHWPADIVVGAGLGICIAIVCIKLPTNAENRWSKLTTHILYLPFWGALIYKYIL